MWSSFSKQTSKAHDACVITKIKERIEYGSYQYQHHSLSIYEFQTQSKLSHAIQLTIHTLNYLINKVIANIVIKFQSI